MKPLSDLFALLETLLAPVVKLAVLALPILAIMSTATVCGGNKEKAYQAAMKSDLRSIVYHQEERRARGEAFTDSLPRSAFQHSSGVMLAGMQQTADGFRVAVDYPSASVYRCQVRHRWGEDVEPRCDEMDPTAMERSRERMQRRLP